jgi:hypothetical protein
MFRFVTAGLILVFILSSTAMSGLCLGDSSDRPSQMTKDDKDCTCRMSSTEHDVALSLQWSPALLPFVDTTLHITSVTLLPTTTTGPQSFDTIIPSPPPKA